MDSGFSEALGSATAQFDGERLRVSTGRIERVWRWTGRGFETTRVQQLPEGRIWSVETSAEGAGADWLLPTVEESNPRGELLIITCGESDDDGFTLPHLAVKAEIGYPEACLKLRFEARAYPDAPGIRTQLFVRTLPGFGWDRDLSRAETTEESLRIARLNRGMVRVDSVPCELAGTQRRYVGYISSRQFRNDTFTEVLKEHTSDHRIHGLETCDWANIATVEAGPDALTLVKESHKLVDAVGHDTGIFRCRPGVGLENLGWGVLPDEISTEWTPAWASWCLVHGSNELSRQTALKTWDRIRYPVRPRDVFIHSDTWGSSIGHRQHREAAGEKSVLQELEAAADLGVDLVQIDDGWQGDEYGDWRPCEGRYPEGWSRVRARAEELGVKLGLWMSVNPAHGLTLEDLKRNFEEGGFVWYKLDFARLRNREAIENLMAMVRAFLLHTEHSARINWDETGPRYGFFFAREYGAVYPANRKTVVPKTTTYRPHTVLRDLWEFSKYLNLLKIVGPVQNVDRVNPLLSDARLYGPAYCVAVSLFSLPVFFQELKLYSEEARKEIRPLLALHHQHRDDIRKGITYPIGERPDGGSWTGFQNHRQEDGAGLLLIFRELANQESTMSMLLRFAAGRRVSMTDLLTGETWESGGDEEGRVPFEIEDAPGFRFLQYRLADA
ncbi:MAG: alpha-galactosidase [Candidatus Brocadiia bacterium]